MKLPSHLAQSRHGVFYFRLTYFINSARKEKRWSLHTKIPAEAKRMSLLISAALRDNPTSHCEDICNSGHQNADACSTELIHRMGGGGMAEDKRMHLITTFHSPGGGKTTLNVDQSDPKDVAAAKKMAQTIMRENAKIVTQPNQGAAVANQFFDSQSFFPSTSGQSVNIEIPSGKTFQESIDHFKARKQGSLAEKTLYEYGQMQQKFANWLSTKKKTKHIDAWSVGRADIADFIDYLKNDGISLQTIQKKYLASLNGLFALAQSSGAYPSGDLPTKNHNIFTQRDKKKAKAKSENKFFDEDELLKIFDPKNLLERNKPCDYWLPLLGLFTGARITELCQLKISDIKKINGIWAVDINDEGDKTVKTYAGIRKIPLHPQLISLGFLEYLEHVRPYSGTIFPYMTPDRFGHYAKTPGRRFGEYLNDLGITGECKVFHSFRATSNNCLKQNGVPEESRCQFIGHEHDTVNSAIYSEKHDMQFLLDNVANKLTFPSIDFSQLKYPQKKWVAKLSHLMDMAQRNRAHEEVKAEKAKVLRDFF